jgi:hypothetical protein
VFTTNTPAIVNVLTTSELKTELPLLPADQSRAFFRAVRLPDSLLTISVQAGQLVIEWPLECSACVLEESGQAGSGASWTPNGATPQNVGGKWRVELPLTSAPRFFKLVLPQ